MVDLFGFMIELNIFCTGDVNYGEGGSNLVIFIYCNNVFLVER